MASPFLEMIGLPPASTSTSRKSPEYRKAKAANDGRDPFLPIRPAAPLSSTLSRAVWQRRPSAAGQHQPRLFQRRPGHHRRPRGHPVRDEYPWEMPLHDDDAIKRTVLDRCQTSFPPCGTARLSEDIQQGVVDPGLGVHGVKNLRVVDASVIPVIPDCRIQNSVYMVAEKGADAIKRDHRDLYP
ncbi:glucose-methanol-choline oxidoreductase, partial [Metarhizium majus ARSEF 297]